MSDTTQPADKQNLDDFLGAPATRPWWRRPTFIVGAVILVVLVLLLSRCFAGEAEGGYATQSVRRGDLQVTVSATGNLQPTNQVEVGSEQSGLITEVYVDNNDRVTQGQPLARLDPARLQDAVTQAQAGLSSAQAQVATAQASAALARANLARQEEVYRVSGGRVPSETELDSARAENRQAQAGVRSADAQVSQARAQLSSAQFNLSRATIFSPVTGVVLSRSIDPGQTVAASFNAPILFIIAEDLSEMKLEVRVDEADVGQVREGQRASFNVDAYPGRTFEARVSRVDVGANASGSTSSSSSSSSTAASGTGSVVAYTAVLLVDNPDLLLRPGMTATADIITSERQNVLLVPNAALRFNPNQDAQAGQQGGITSVLVPRGPRRGGRGGRAQREVGIGAGSRQTVYVLGEDGNPRPVQVVVGQSDGSRTEITGGELQEGMQVITARLAPGQVQEDKNGDGQRGQGRQREGQRGGGGEDGNAAATNATAPAPAAGTPPSSQPPRQPSPEAPPVGPQPSPDARPAPGAAGGGGERQRMRDMTPEQRKAYLESLTPEQRAAMNERRRQRREARPDGGEASPPDGE
ncbi:efflux RND transporter periplasmic adaptor subunit [Sphingosinicella sp. LHD-64]|uniref:efflux RND transporter periplasmic adaptor subunit n=1 Tax=Sphingosinicella sp. LHD-64 TaxID=3072139 RepID=UPI00280C621E|nr:efflux RND transporter periplasmic adaptor subunit [Sphingosinicella sp. LHD-64]MDQ8755760.1 efflux RND transporter periplasmic adaptor subunit [Sphingosinicella sp. LHD-64]